MTLTDQEKASEFEAGVTAPDAKTMAIGQQTLDWIDLNLAIAQLRALPQTENTLANALSTTEQQLRDRFYELKDLNVEIVGDAEYWDKELFPKTRELANQLVNQSKIMVDHLETTRMVVEENATAAQKEEFIKFLGKEYTTAYEYALKSQKEAISFKQDLTNFQALFKGHKASLSSLKTAYSTAHNLNEQKAKELQEEMKKLLALISQLQKQYDKDVAIATNTVTYFWATIYGLGVAIFYAVKYGVAATAVLEQIKAQKAILDEKQTESKLVNGLLGGFSAADSFIANVSKNVDTVITVLDDVIYDWERILSSLSVFVEQGDRQNQILAGSFFLNDIIYKKLVRQWQAIEQSALDYVKGCLKYSEASVPPTNPPELSQAVLQLENSYKKS